MQMLLAFSQHIYITCSELFRKNDVLPNSLRGGLV